jgi:transcriptional regulator with XRE-family HTH domain
MARRFVALENIEDIGKRLRQLRKKRRMSYSDVRRATYGLGSTVEGLQASYQSQVENGHVIPSLNTIGKWAKGLGIPIWRIFYEGPDATLVGAESTDGQPDRQLDSSSDAEPSTVMAENDSNVSEKPKPLSE